MKQACDFPEWVDRSPRRILYFLLGCLLILALPVQAEQTKPLTLRLPAQTQLHITLPTASLEFYQYGDIKHRIDEKYVDPAAKKHTVSFEADLGKEMPVKKVLWQVSQMPFVGSLDAPPGLLLSGSSEFRVFDIDFAEVARKAKLPNAPKPGSARPTLKAPILGPTELELIKPPSTQAVPSTTDPNTQASKPVILKPGLLNAATRGIYTPIKRTFYVRVVPMDPNSTAQAPRLVGLPSEALRVVWAAPPAASAEIAPDTFDVVSTEPINLLLKEFKFIPQVSIENWPEGCEPIPRDEGGFKPEKVGEFLLDTFDWASTAYGDIKDAVVSAVAFLLPFVPESVISVALDAALASAGLPPSIPNIDQMIDGGADYLAVQMAAQIPIPATGPLAEMAAEEARNEIQKQSKAALLDTAKRLREQQKNSSRYCRAYYASPYFEITVRNGSQQSIDNVTLQLEADSKLFETIRLPIDRIGAGETLTIPVAYLDKANIEVKHHSQLPGKDLEKAEGEWWETFMATPMSFRVGLPTRRDCYGDGNCLILGSTALQTPKRVWFHEPAYAVKK